MVCVETSSTATQDLKAVWHPFVQRAKSSPPIPVVKAKGCTLYAEDGSTYLDAISSWWVNLHGHCHPHIMQAIQLQVERYDQIIFTDFTHAVAVSLATRLLQALPKAYSKVFFSDNGSTAMEIALKMALHYWKNKGVEKTVICAFEGGYHGDTFGSMSLAGKSYYSTPFWPYFFDVHLIPPPFEGEEEKSLNALKQISNCACMIFEPHIQGAHGMRIYSKEGLNALMKECSKHEILTIADEVMTGFGRTGPLFVSATLESKPDILALSKGITGGALPLAATVCQEHIHRAFVSQNPSHTFLHAHSYTANPIACAAALASLDLTLDARCDLNRYRITKAHERFCQKWKGHSKFKRVELLGTILVVEIAEKTAYHHPLREQMIAYFMSKGILLRPIGNVIYVLPPYCITDEELITIYQTIEEGVIRDFRL